MSDDDYMHHAHRVQTAIAMLLELDPKVGANHLGSPKDLRTGIDMSKADQAGLVTLLIAKGVFTMEEYIAALTASAKVEADSKEAALQAILSHKGVQTL